MIDHHVKRFDLKTLEGIFSLGPWNSPTMMEIRGNLQGLNEYSNVVGYLFNRTINRLVELGSEGKKIASLKMSNLEIRDCVYYEHGGNYGKRVRLAESVKI